MDNNYAPLTIESKWYKIWQKNHNFTAKNTTAESYSIMLPPPNVTGTLHMGHAFQHTLIDILVRYQRMCGKDTLWQPGTDHAGIATQMVVEKKLAANKIKLTDIGRDKFVEKVWQWREQSGNKIISQMKRLGASADWSRQRFTLDDGLSQVVKKVFIQLYNEKLIYRGEKLTNWDPQLQTAISDLEVISVSEKTSLWHIKYSIASPTQSDTKFIIIVTTRPETIFGDSAIAVNPADKRFTSLVGKKVVCPLSNRVIPVIADDYVDMEFGSGCVKITPAHDFNDYAIGKRHNLDVINIFTSRAHLNTNVPPEYQGLERFAARSKVVADLQKAGLLYDTQNYTTPIPRGERSGAIIEPYLTQQWFLNMDSLVGPAIDVVKKGEIQFIPARWDKTYFAWLENIQDWCISRQLWWGHRIPVWYDQDGNHYAGNDVTEVRKQYSLAADLVLQQETDVLDTWFSSALWTFSTLGWPDTTVEMQKFHPTSVLVTGFDIIFFWVARMIMMSLKMTGEIPFKQVYVHGLVRDSVGQKMSKSKGNVIDPLDVIDGINLASLVTKRLKENNSNPKVDKIISSTKETFPQGIAAYGADSLRFTFCSLASTGRDIRFELGRLEGYNKFCNKLWNASKFVLIIAHKYPPAANLIDKNITSVERWIIAQTQMCIQNYTQALAEYRFDLAANFIYEFVWHQYCDWYIELAKATLDNPAVSSAQKAAVSYTLVTTLETILRLAHPIIPFITEELWQQIAPLIFPDIDSIMLASFPRFEQNKLDDKACADIQWLQNIISAIRSLLSQNNINPKQKLPLLISQAIETEKILLTRYDFIITKITNLQDITVDDTLDYTTDSYISQQVGSLLINIAIDQLVVDIQTEYRRLTTAIKKTTARLSQIAAKLGNQNFINNAPPKIVLQTQQQQQEMNILLSQYQQQLNKITDKSNS